MMAKKRYRITRNDILLAIARGSPIIRSAFVVICLVTLVGSSFMPDQNLSVAQGSIGSGDNVLSETLAISEPEDKGLSYTVYEVRKGDTVSDIADTFDISVDTVLSMNDIQSARSLKPGQLLKIPNMAGIVYEVKKGDTVKAVADKFEISAKRIVEVNGLKSEEMSSSRTLFLPDAKLPSTTVREISGDLFKWPVRGVITSWFSWRRDPFSGKNSFHNGLDIGVPLGTPIGAAMEGTVSEAGYSPIMGKYVQVSHSGGWKTLYAHMSSIQVQEGQYVNKGDRLGLSGNTGYSTGPHVHFSVFKNGKAVNPANVLQ
ncbi:MAG: M23 family metallopeptidase [Spirochaetaceae bacterium]|nr:M23 family metallopeptidase [Spirochaetaceae bacterium]